MVRCEPFAPLGQLSSELNQPKKEPLSKSVIHHRKKTILTVVWRKEWTRTASILPLAWHQPQSGEKRRTANWKSYNYSWRISLNPRDGPVNLLVVRRVKPLVFDRPHLKWKVKSQVIISNSPTLRLSAACSYSTRSLFCRPWRVTLILSVRCNLWFLNIRIKKINNQVKGPQFS